MPNQDQINLIAKEAGAAILTIYHDESQFQVVDFKGDDSPLTLADKKAHDIIVKRLQQYFPDIPIISEEGEETPYEERKNWDKFWLVDPLDGTKEFINRNGQFTVNIALIDQGKPVMGVVHVPALKETYFGSVNEGAFFQQEENDPIKIQVNNKSSDRIAVRSRSHASPEEEEVLSKYGVTDSISVGSSLKFCMVAAGKADVYYRHGPTMEWDTAAGQAVVEAAGATVYTGTGPEVFTYNKEVLKNGSFLVLGF